MTKHRILFVCTGRGGRSLVAEEFTNYYAQGQVDAFSSSFTPGKIGSLPITIMEELGFDLSEKEAKLVFDRYRDNEVYDYVVALCHGVSQETCPVFKSNLDALFEKDSERRTWMIPSFKDIEGTTEEKLKAARFIRDKIQEEVKLLLSEIGVSLDHL